MPQIRQLLAEKPAELGLVGEVPGERGLAGLGVEFELPERLSASALIEIGSSAVGRWPDAEAGVVRLLRP